MKFIYDLKSIKYMRVKVVPEVVNKDKAVSLSQVLPTDRLFGNKYEIKEGTRGYVTSKGFEGGRLRIQFYTSGIGTQHVEFNELSAKEFLETEY